MFHYTFSLFSIPKIDIIKEVTGPVCRALPSHFRNGVLSCEFPLIKLTNFKMDLGIVVFMYNGNKCCHYSYCLVREDGIVTC